MQSPWSSDGFTENVWPSLYRWAFHLTRLAIYQLSEMPTSFCLKTSHNLPKENIEIPDACFALWYTKGGIGTLQYRSTWANMGLISQP
jgi:hypothetical protein